MKQIFQQFVIKSNIMVPATPFMTLKAAKVYLQRQLNLHFRDHLRLWIQRQIVSMTIDQSSIAI